MSKHTATIFLNGVGILSYVADPGRILSPSTLPRGLSQDIADAVGLVYEADAVGWGGGSIVTTQESDHVFKMSASLTLIGGRRVRPDEPGYAGPCHWTYVDTDRVEVQWVGTSDYAT